MIAGLCVGTWLWLGVDPTRDVFEEDAADTLGKPAAALAT